MKELYLLPVAMLVCVLCSTAQFTDDIESYDEGPVFTDRWTTWDGTDDGEQNAIVSTTYAASGTKSIFIDAGAADGGPQDAILNLGDEITSGAWSVRWSMYIPTGNSAYFNIQGEPRS